MNPTLVTTTEAVDKAFYIILGICGVMLLGIAVAMVWFVWRYNRKRQPQPLSQKDHNLWLEVIWTVIPTLLVMLMFWYGWEGYLSLRRIPDGAMQVKVSARMWSWQFTYENGKTADKLYVPVGRPVKVELVAEDVLHSFYVPAFRVKRDTVPGMVNYAWFVAEQAGSYDLFCAEYCGVGHAAMITTVEALPPGEFAAWLNQQPAAGAAADGTALLKLHGCLGCHSLDGSRMVGPTFKDIADRTVEVEAAGARRTLSRDRDYLRRALLEPGGEVVAGYPPVMPSYAGRLAADELEAILDTLLGTAPGVAPAANAGSVPEAETVAEGAALAQRHGCLACHSLDGNRANGPTFAGLFGSRRVVRAGKVETTVTADAAYLERAMVEPKAEVVLGYPPAMPAFDQLSAAERAALVAWLRSLSRP